MKGTEPSAALFTDLYQLTMAQVYWQNGMAGQATFSLYFRTYPPDRAYLVFAGLEDALGYLETLAFADSDIDYLRSEALFDDGFLEFLKGLQFTGRVRAMPEGTVFFANEPVVEVTAPIIEAQIVETYLLNQVNLQSILATKASRVVTAAKGRTLVDFGARRAHGTDAADKLARASYMVGFAGTSNVGAGRRYGIPIFGTMAHSLVEAFPHEEESFRAYARSFPDSTTLLVDTYDVVEGVRTAAEVGGEMRRSGHSLRALRLDSGDLLDLSKKARAMLDKAGLHEVQVFASGGLDEFEVSDLVEAGAPIDGFGVGTKVGVSADAPWTDCAYKLVEYDGRPTMKLSSQKQTAPGPKQVFRYRDDKGTCLRDVIAIANERPSDAGGEPLLSEVMAAGKRTARPPTLQQLREAFAAEFGRLPEAHKAIRSPAMYEVTPSEALESLTRAVSEETRQRHMRS